MISNDALVLEFLSAMHKEFYVQQGKTLRISLVRQHALNQFNSKTGDEKDQILAGIYAAIQLHKTLH